MVDNLKKLNAIVVSVHMMGGHEGKIEWVDFINKKEMYNWINAWNPYSYEYKLKYDVQTTPVLLLLDENKKIIAKKIGAEQVDKILSHKLENKN